MSGASPDRSGHFPLQVGTVPFKRCILLLTRTSHENEVQGSHEARIGGMLTPFFILVILGLLFAVLSIPFSQYPLLAVAVILLAVSLLIGKTG